MLPRAAPCAAALALLAAACGQTRIDGPSVARELDRALGGPGRFSCPDPRNAVGVRFTCTRGGERVEVEVRPREAIRIVRRG